MKVCSFKGCDKCVLAKGLCAGHYDQQKTGAELRPLRSRASSGTSVEARLRMHSRFEQESGCRVWTKATANGYARIGIAGKSYLAHRAAWEEVNGPLPEGMILDHLCHNRACINVQHLRLTTQANNCLNREGSTSSSGYRCVTRNGSGWAARPGYHGMTYYLGTYDTPEQAYAEVLDFWERNGIVHNSTEQRDLWEEVTT